MSKKLAGYVFRRIRGRIVPIRKGLEVASKEISQVADVITKLPAKATPKMFAKSGVKKLGAGADFKVFAKATDPTEVIKIPKGTKGTANKAFIKAYPHTADKLAVAKALGDNLPNYGIPTIESKIVRLKNNLRGLVQSFQKKPNYITNTNRLNRDAQKLKFDEGLDIDAHHFNQNDNGYLVDTGGALSKSSIKKVKESGAAKELLGIETYYGTELKDHFNKSEMITESVATESASAAVLRKLNAFKKKGFRLKSDDGENFKLLNPLERVTRAQAKGVRFVKINGRIVPIRGKKK